MRYLTRLEGPGTSGVESVNMGARDRAALSLAALVLALPVAFGMFVFPLQHHSPGETVSRWFSVAFGVVPACLAVSPFALRHDSRSFAAVARLAGTTLLIGGAVFWVYGLFLYAPAAVLLL